MSTSATKTPSHPVADFVARAHARLDDLDDRPLWTMTDTEAAHALLEASRLVARAQALELRLAAHADRTEIGHSSGATSTAVWWANQTRQVQRDAAQKMKLAKGLDHHDCVADALSVGRINTDQARVITRAVDKLPDTVQPEVRTQARDHLLEQAAHHDAKALAILGRRILDVVAPEVGEAEEARQLAAEERKAEAKARLTMTDLGDGRTRGEFEIPTHAADKFRVQLGAIASPRAGGEGSTPHGMGLALVEYIGRYPTEKLPKSGGIDATVVVTMTLETLLGAEKAATLSTGTRISPGLARRMACESGVIPAVLGGRSLVLDLGRKKRLYSRTQHLAMMLRHGGCAAMGCERPGAWCDAHHLTPWSKGGRTDLKDGALLCTRHHTLAHDPMYELRLHPDGRISFIKRE